MLLKRNGIEFSVADGEVARIVIERFTAPEPANDGPEILLDFDPPARIGEAWQGGIYAGLARGREGETDYHLIVGPEHEGDIAWAAAADWAKALDVDGWKDFSLPTRKEQALCFANAPELFKPLAYWSSEQHASYSDYAWGQNFGYGGQYDWFKSYELRARAVRRLPIH